MAVPKPSRSSSRRNKDWARTAENAHAKAQTEAGMPAKRVFLSGAAKGVGLDGDVQAEWYIAEAKNRTPDIDSRGGKTISLPLGILAKIEEEAAIHGLPGIVIVHPKGGEHDSDLVVVRRKVFMDLMGRAYSALKLLKESV